MGRPVVLGSAGAAMLAGIFDSASVGAASCSGKPDVVLRFAYPNGSEADVEVFGTGCAAPMASVGGKPRLLEPELASYLDTDASASWLAGTSVPDLTGLSLRQATAIAVAAGRTVSVSGRATDASVPAGTVLLQDPPAGTGDIGNEVGLLLTQLPAPTCRPAQLAIDYHGLSYGTGSNFATLDVRDVSSIDCTLVEPVAVVGLDRAGRPVTNPEPFSVAPGLVLTAHAAKRDIAQPVPLDAAIAWIGLQADVRDGPDADGSCAGHLVVPARWLVTIAGASSTVPNGDPADPSMSACQGRLDVPVPQDTIKAW